MAIGVRPAGSGGHHHGQFLLRLAALLAPLLVTLFLPVPRPEAHAQRASAPSPLGHISYIWHGLSVQPPRRALVRGTLKMPLFQAYLLRTLAAQRAAMGFVDGTVIDMDERTDAYLASPARTEVRQGTVAEFLMPGTDHTVVTNSAVASAIGTTFLVSNQGGASTFVVLHGALQVTNGGGSVVVESNQATTAAPGSAPRPPHKVNAAAAFAWTDQIPAPDLGENLALDADGGRIVGVSSERGGAWSARNLNDGLLSTAWESAAGHIAHQRVTISFLGGNAYRLATIIIDPAGPGNQSSPADLRDFEIMVSTSGTAQSDFTRIYSGTCREQAGLQTFHLPVPTLARYVQLVALNNYGDPNYLAVTEFEAVANESSLAYPWGNAVDAAGNNYLADLGNDRIVKISPRGKQLAAWGQKGHSPGQFDLPWDVAVNPQGNIYVADTGNHRIQELDASGLPIRTWGSFGRGDGQFNRPAGLAIDRYGDVFVADTFNDRVQEFTGDGNWLGSFGQTGSGGGQFISPYGVAVDPAGNIFVADTGNRRVQELSPTGKPERTWGMPFSPWRVAVGPSGILYVSGGTTANVLGEVSVDLASPTAQGLIRIAPDGTVQPWGTRGTGNGKFLHPTGLAVDLTGNLHVADAGTDRVVELAPSGAPKYQWGLFGVTGSVLGQPVGIALDAAGDVYVSDGFYARVQEFAPDGHSLAVWGREGRTANPNTGLGDFYGAAALTVDAHGVVYVADGGNRRVQRLNSRGPARAWIGPGAGSERFYDPTAVTADAQGNIYVADCDPALKYARIYELAPDGHQLAHWGAWGTGTQQFECASGLAVDAQGNIDVSDFYSSRVLVWAHDGTVVRTIGSPGAYTGQFAYPGGLALDRNGNLYVADTYNNRVQEFDASGRFVAAFGGFGSGPTQFILPQAVAVDPDGNLYVADSNNERIVKLNPDGQPLATWE